MITSLIGLTPKFYAQKPKYLIETIGYHSLLFIESFLIPSVKFLLVQFFLVLVLTYFAAMLIWRNYFHKHRFLSFLQAPLHLPV